jgi:hypothetical protein
MYLQKIKINRTNKAVLKETSFVKALKFAYISFQPYRMFQIKFIAYLIQSSEDFMSTGIVAFFLTLTTILFAYQQDQRISNREYAIITTPSVTVKGAPDASGTSLFLIHEGLKVQLLEELGDWYNIRLADGNEGWVARTDLEKI